MIELWYKSFKLVDLSIKSEGFIYFKLVETNNNYILEGCTKEDNWQEYAQTVVDNYYEWLNGYYEDNYYEWLNE